MPLYFDWTCVIEFRDACFRGRASLKRWMLSGNFDARGRDARGLRNQYLRILAHNSLSALAKTQYVDLDQAVSRGGGLQPQSGKPRSGFEALPAVRKIS